MGVFEWPRFAEGTKAVAQAVAEAEAFSVVGGGDSVRALTELGLADRVVVHGRRRLARAPGRQGAPGRGGYPACVVAGPGTRMPGTCRAKSRMRPICRIRSSTSKEPCPVSNT